jgi:hypothetical protein
MKKSGIFWLIILASVLYFAYTLGWVYLGVTYVVWMILGVIIHNNIDDIDIVNYNDDFQANEIRQLFLEYPYLFTCIHLFFIGVITGFYHSAKRIGNVLSNFNNAIDNFEVKLPKKEKKKSFSEYRKDSLE